MKILSIDTSSDVCGVSILENTNLICKLDTITKQSHSENLMPMINNAFNKSNLEINDMDLIACDIGPGSFTGIRIGVATSKAFIDSLNIPYVGISALEALAYNLLEKTNKGEIVCSIIDCKNGNCYFALYEKDSNSSFETLINPDAESIEAALSIVHAYYDNLDTQNPITFVGDGSKIYASQIISFFDNAKFATENSNILDSYFLGIAALNKYNLQDDCEELLPLYLKKPQAQRQLEEKLLKEL